MSNGRDVGWEFVHACVDDASRIAFSQIRPDEQAASAVVFLRATIAYYKSLGVTVTGDKRKPPEGGDPNSIRTNQARRKERLFFLRYAIKPMLAKPSTIIAQVEGSGTAEIVKVWVPELSG